MVAERNLHIQMDYSGSKTQVATSGEGLCLHILMLFIQKTWLATVWDRIMDYVDY